MPEARNPLRGDGQPREQLTGDKFINLRTQKRVRMPGPDGNMIEVTTMENETSPDVNGNYLDTETTYLVTDAAGSVIPSDPRMVLGFSHSGLVITAPEEAAVCSSWFHPSNRSRTIKLGHDGHSTSTGAICSICAQRLYMVSILAFIFCIAVVWGVWKGAGLF